MMFFIRYLGALIYDALIICVLLFVLSAILILFNHGQAIPSSTRWYQFTLLVFALLYYGNSMKFGGQTLGMRSWRFKLISVNKNGLSKQQILARILLSIPALFIAPFYFKGSYTLLNRWTKTDFFIQ